MFREQYRQSGLFKVGVISLAGSMVFVAIVVILVHLPDKQAASAEPAAETTTEPPDAPLRVEAAPEPTQASIPAERTEREQPKPEKLDEQARPEPKKLDSGTTAPSASKMQDDQPSPSPAPRQEQPDGPSSVAPRSGGSQGSLPVQGDDWPGADRQEVGAAGEPREYGWARGAMMTLTSSALGVSNAPVFGDDSQRNLDQGVVHVPETSLPWERGRQKNVYLAAHRLGWPGTGSRLIFYNLGQLQKGDKVFLENRRGDTYRYRVTEKLVVEPSDSWVMGEVRGKDILSLQTCTPIPTFHKRLIVRAERV